jgi:hypothetical protein
MTASRTRRTNNEGHPCPPWCVTDHAKVHGAAGTDQSHRGARAGIKLPGTNPYSKDPISAGPAHDGTESGRAHVALSGYRPGASLAGVPVCADQRQRRRRPRRPHRHARRGNCGAAPGASQGHPQGRIRDRRGGGAVISGSAPHPCRRRGRGMTGRSWPPRLRVPEVGDGPGRQACICGGGCTCNDGPADTTAVVTFPGGAPAGGGSGDC